LINSLKNISLILLLVVGNSYSQVGFLPLGEDAYNIFERQAILSGDSLGVTHLGVYPIQRKHIERFAETKNNIDDLEDEQLYFLLTENDQLYPDVNISANQKPFLKYFWKNKGQFLSVRQPNFGLVLNPVLYLKYSNNQSSGDPVFQNTRGVAIHGHLDRKVYFESQLLETQSSFPDYVERRMDRDTFVQGNGFFKSYTSSVFNINRGYDYLNSSGRIGIQATKSIDFSFGYDRNFIGSGIRSLFLSDFANNYSNLRINTKVWKIQYQNIFAEFFNNGTFSSVAKTKEKKYFSGHYLKFNFTPNIHFGVFEGVIYSGELGLQPALLNPIIFYRSIEGFANQDGNAMLGADFRINAFKRFSVYGQLILDEFKFNEVFGDEPGWWANKFGIQLGAKYFNVLGIENLDGILEFNTVRPYTYGHRTKLTSYSNFNQPLAHPLGANFKEVIGKVNYRIGKNWNIEANIGRMSYGDDLDSTHWGSNVLISYNEREQDYNNTISQGIDTDVWLINLNLSYRVGHDLFLDLEYNLRQQDSDLDTRDYTENYIGFAVRANIARLRHFY